MTGEGYRHGQMGSELERMAKKRGADGGKTSTHLASYEFKAGSASGKGNNRVKVVAHCYRCLGGHTWAEGCPKESTRPLGR